MTITKFSFSQKEILTPDQYEFLEMIQELRNYYASPMNVNSWIRSKKHNQEVGGSSNSLHLDGFAVDIAIKCHPLLLNKWKQICAKHNKIGGINLYDTFTHFSIHEEKFGYKSFVIRDYRKEK